MTKITAERQYDITHNEGNEGYNPNRDCQRIVDEINAKAESDLAAWQADRDAKFHTEWTVDVTVARRADWNGFARANMTPKGLPAKLANDRMDRQGWTTDDLRKAVKLHNL